MPSSYCWGDRHTPARILDESDDTVIVEIDSATRTIPLSKIVGRVSDSDRIQVLVSGGAWLWGHAHVDEVGLWVVLDSGRRWVLRDARWIKVVQKQLDLFAVGNNGEPTVDKSGMVDKPNCQLRRTLTPDLSTQPVSLPELCDALDGELTRAMESLEPLKEGDRVRVVLAGKPLEHLTGALGTVEGVETLGLVPVLVDGHGSGLFRREALDLVDSAFDPLPYLDIPFTFDPDRDITKPDITIGTKNTGPIMSA